MAALRHSFYLTASLQQRLTFLAVAVLSLGSFLFWPTAYSDSFLGLKIFLFLLVLTLLVGHYIKLSRWQVNLTLCDLDAPLLDNRPCEFVRCYVMPLACFVYVRDDVKEHLIIVFRDMLSDSDYRLLCRLLLRQNKGSSEAPF